MSKKDNKIQKESQQETISVYGFDKEFFLFPNYTARSKKISFEAKGLLAHLLSLPKDWVVHVWQLVQEYEGMRGGGKDAIQRILKELREAGYVEYNKFKNEKGQWCHSYKVYPLPVTNYQEIQKIFPERENPALENPALENPALENPVIYKDRNTETEKQKNIDKVNDGKKNNGIDVMSLTQSINDKKSLFSGKAKFTQEQQDTLDWLKTLKLDTSEDTLSWWARTYSLSRLEEVHREAVKRKPKSLGAYIQRLLKKGAVVISGRIEANAEYASMLKELRGWHSLEIYQKYASIRYEGVDVEIDFNMEPQIFRKYLEQKYSDFEQNGHRQK